MDLPIFSRREPTPTLGYGDITLGEEWGLLAAFQAATGLFMFGWSTAIIVAAVQRIYFRQPPRD